MDEDGDVRERVAGQPVSGRAAGAWKARCSDLIVRLLRAGPDKLFPHKLFPPHMSKHAIPLKKRGSKTRLMTWRYIFARP